MAKRTPDPHAKREYCVEYYKRAQDMTPMGRSGYTIDIWGARLGAVRALILDHAEKAVCVKRKSGRVQWTRIRSGGNILYQPGDADASSFAMANVVPLKRKAGGA